VVVDPQAVQEVVVEYLVKTVWALLVVIAALALGRLARGATGRAMARQRAHPNVVVLLGNLSQLLVFLLGTLVVLAIYTEAAFGWILTSFSVLGLVVGLSLQDILKNFFAGIWILIERPFRIGDVVQVGEHTGIVQEISFRTMHLRTEDGREVVVPNGNLMTSAVVNLTRYPNRSTTLAVAIPADAVPADVADRVRDLLGSFDSIADDPAPLVHLRGYGGGLFLPFRDATNGETTYAAGRYILDTAKGADLGGDPSRATLIVDLNFAYQPSCAFDPRWACPLAPPENRLDVAIEAGERIR